MNLFTYGTLMFPPVWQRVVGLAVEATPATAHGFAAYTVGGEVYPGLVPEAGASTPGVVYVGLDAALLARLDAFEGPQYTRGPLEALGADGRQRRCHAYLLRPEFRGVLSPHRWTAEWFERGGRLEAFMARYAGFFHPPGTPA